MSEESDRTLLLSIRARYADRIFEGKKNIELRKVKPSVVSGDPVLVYVPSPVKALIGEFEVHEVVKGKPGTIWRKFGSRCGIERSEFDSYYDGASTAYGIVLRQPGEFPRPLELGALRKLLPKFCPPQSYRYLRRNEVDIVRRAVRSPDRLGANYVQPLPAFR